MELIGNDLGQLFAKTQNADGIDVARIASNLKLTPTERVLKAQQAARILCEVKNAAYTAGLRKPN